MSLRREFAGAEVLRPRELKREPRAARRECEGCGGSTGAELRPVLAEVAEGLDRTMRADGEIGWANLDDIDQLFADRGQWGRGALLLRATRGL